MALQEDDPIDWELDDNDQLIIPIRYVRGRPAIRQRVRFKMMVAKGECAFNLDVGTPWLATDDGVVTESDALLGDDLFEATKTMSVIRRQIESVPGVVQVTKITASYDGAERQVLVTWSAKTAFGDLGPDTIALDLAI